MNLIPKQATKVAILNVYFYITIVRKLIILTPFVNIESMQIMRTNIFDDKSLLSA